MKLAVFMRRWQSNPGGVALSAPFNAAMPPADSKDSATMVTLWARLALALLLATICGVTGAAAQEPHLDCAKHPGLLHPIFSDYMVLQRNASVPVWGCTKPGSNVTVTIAGKTVQATANTGGLWKLRLAPMPEGGPYSMVVTAATSTRTLANVLVGDV